MSRWDDFWLLSVDGSYTPFHIFASKPEEHLSKWGETEDCPPLPESRILGFRIGELLGGRVFGVRNPQNKVFWFAFFWPSVEPKRPGCFKTLLGRGTNRASIWLFKIKKTCWKNDDSRQNKGKSNQTQLKPPSVSKTIKMRAECRMGWGEQLISDKKWIRTQ